MNDHARTEGGWSNSGIMSEKARTKTEAVEIGGKGTRGRNRESPIGTLV